MFGNDLAYEQKVEVEQEENVYQKKEEQKEEQKEEKKEIFQPNKIEEEINKNKEQKVEEKKENEKDRIKNSDLLSISLLPIFQMNIFWI